MGYRKYKNIKIEKDGIEFDSIAESRYYTQLKLRKKAGDIRDFECQPKYELQPKFKCEGKTIRKMTYTADFKVFHEGYTEIVDVKSPITAKKESFVNKWKRLKFMYGQTGEYKFTIIINGRDI